jgi:hypothetical protein
MKANLTRRIKFKEDQVILLINKILFNKKNKN